MKAKELLPDDKSCSNCDHCMLYENENTQPSDKYYCEISEDFINDIDQYYCNKHEQN